MKYRLHNWGGFGGVVDIWSFIITGPLNTGLLVSILRFNIGFETGFNAGLNAGFKTGLHIGIQYRNLIFDSILDSMLESILDSMRSSERDNPVQNSLPPIGIIRPNSHQLRARDVHKPCLDPKNMPIGPL